MAASDRALVRSLAVPTGNNNNNNNGQSHEQSYESTRLFNDSHNDHRSKSIINRSSLFKPMSRLFGKARAATVGKRMAPHHLHLHPASSNNSNSRPSITSLFDTPSSLSTEQPYTPDLMVNHQHQHHHLSNSSDHVVVASTLTSPMETPCDDAITVTRNICTSPEQTTMDAELLESDSSSYSVQNQILIDIVYSAHTVAVCTHHPYTENRRGMLPVWQQGEQQQQSNTSSNNVMEDELVAANIIERHGRRSLGKRAWHGLRQQIARALPHLSRPRTNTEHHLDVDYESRFHMVRGRSRTMPLIATTSRAMATSTDLLVRQQRHVSDTVNAAAAAELLQPPPYMQGALYPFAWAPNRASFTISVTVSRHTTPCGSGYATPNPRSGPTSAGANSPIPTPWGSCSNLRASLEDNQQQHYSIANDTDGRTFPLPPSSLKPRRPFKHAPVAAPACRAPEINTIPQRTRQQQSTFPSPLQTRERSSSASAFSYTTTVAPTLAAIRTGAYRNSSSCIETATAAATTTPSSPVLGNPTHPRSSSSTSSQQHDMVVEAHEQVDALLHFSQALGHAILEIQDSLVLWEQPAVVRALARRPEVYLYTHWPESIRRQMIANAAAINADTQSQQQQQPVANSGGVGSDFAPGTLLLNNHRRTSSSHSVSLSGSANTSNTTSGGGGDTSTDTAATTMDQEPLLPLLPDVVRQLVIQADQALLRAHTSKARALLKQAVDPLSDQVALAKTLMASVVDTTQDDNDEASAATILPIPLSPSISSKIGGAAYAADIPLQSTKQEVRERGTAAFTEFSSLFREVARASDVSEDLMRQARSMANVEPAVRTTREALGRLSGSAKDCQELNTEILDRLKRLSWISDELDLDSMTRRPPA
ncbi:hypothetical protein BDF22DRAFT_740089 [Syncephalis plumigaleata]|nr:hypothetical protein BDF22DRAFT_740089 [Syncephalis plumigaleata]